MIALALLAMAPAVKVYELIDPSVNDISIQAIARLPKLTDRQANALDMMVDEIPRTVEGYSRRDMMDTTNGDAIHCVAGPDYVRIYFSVPKQNFHAGLGLLEALVHTSQLAPPESPTLKRISAWDAALRPFQSSAPGRQADAEELYRTLFRSENLSIAVGGAVIPGDAADEWQKRVDKWPAIRYRETPVVEAEPKLYLKNPSGMASLELSGPSFGASDAALPTRTLALFALGSGKGASLFRIVRQKLGYSYRQEALLYPVSDGWQPRLIMVMRPTEDLLDRGANARKALLEDVANWGPTDLARALGMTEAVFMRGVDFSPFAFGTYGALDGSLASRTFQSAYWQMKTGQPWDAPAFLDQMRKVRLEDLKETATKILTDAQLRVLPG